MANTKFYPTYSMEGKYNNITIPFLTTWNFERRKMGTLPNVLVLEDFTVLIFKPPFVRVKIGLLQLFVIYMYPLVCVRVYIYKIKCIQKHKS